MEAFGDPFAGWAASATTPAHATASEHDATQRGKAVTPEGDQCIGQIDIARTNQRAHERDIKRKSKLGRRASGVLAAPAADVDAQLSLQGRQTGALMPR